MTRATLAGLVVGCCVAAAACTYESAPRRASAEEIRKARAFDERATYWLGPSFRDLPLRSADIVVRNELHITYGHCTPTGPEPRCTLPLDIQQYPTCRRSLWLYARFGAHVPTDAEGRERLARMRHRLVTVRGVPALTRDDGLEIYTGNSTIVIFGERGLREAAARQLRGFNRLAGGIAPEDPLPKPAPGTLGPVKPCFHTLAK